MTDSGDIGKNVTWVRERIAQAEARAGRENGSVQLVAVTKRVEAERVAEAVRAGITDLGENYVQEALPKQESVRALLTPELPAPNWHLIGGLQTNKVNKVIGQFALLQSVDSLRLAQAINARAERQETTESVLIEVNIARAEGRPGVLPEAALDLASQIVPMFHVKHCGFMGVAPVEAGADAEAARPYFRTLYKLWELLPEENRQILSMGMSGDFEVAIEEGATLVRVGTALFGARKG